AKPMNSAARPPAASIQPDRLGAVQSALDRDELDSARKLLETVKTDSGSRPDPAILLLEAQLAMKQGHARQAGGKAIEIVVEYPKSPQHPDALFVAATSQEKLGRPGKALELYRRCADANGTSPETKRRAQERIDALAPAASGEAPPSGGRP